MAACLPGRGSAPDVPRENRRGRPPRHDRTMEMLKWRNVEYCRCCCDCRVVVVEEEEDSTIVRQLRHGCRPPTHRRRDDDNAAAVRRVAAFMVWLAGVC
jgi:hypothetical protein